MVAGRQFLRKYTLLVLICYLIPVTPEESLTTSNTKDVLSQEPENKKDTKDRGHVTDILLRQSPSLKRDIVRASQANAILSELVAIYHSSIKPIEDLYRYSDIAGHHITDGEISAKPLILFVGPWSTGKTTMINYLIGIEDAQERLHTGAEPTTSDFTVIMHGPKYRTVDGMVLTADRTRGFSALEKYGLGFLERFQGIEMPHSLLERVTIIDTPGIIENRKQQERGYPLYSVMKWFIDRADLIAVVFDPTKLDIGLELEQLFCQLKGRESQVRIILNKADTISMQELMRVYGALFWGLAPLINVTEPPRVYTGSFWGKHFKDESNSDLFLREELSLLQDIRETINNQLENRIAFIRQHAIHVRIHAILVNQYLVTFYKKKSIFSDQEELLAKIIETPEKYHIYRTVLTLPTINKYDLPSSDKYKEFFSLNSLSSFHTLDSHCSIFSGCPIDNILEAISFSLPRLIQKIERDPVDACSGNYCPPDETIQP